MSSVLPLMSSREGSAHYITFARGEKRIDMNIRNITTTSLSRVFGVDPSTVWLKDDMQGKAYIPDDSGNFNISEEDLLPYEILFVEGPDKDTNSSPIIRSSVNTSNTVRPRAQSHIPLPCRPNTSHQNTRISVKIIQANIVGKGKGRKPLFEVGQVAYISIDHSDIGVETVKREIRRRWGEDYTLVTAEGAEILESTGTTDPTFWKVAARKFYVVPENDLILPTKKQQKLDDDNLSVENKLDSLKENIISIKKQLDSVLALPKSSEVPPGLLKLIEDSLKCKICHNTPVKPPIMMAMCCKSVVGCETCVDQWYLDSNSKEELALKLCPLCKSERAFAQTVRLHGLDELAEGISPLFQNN